MVYIPSWASLVLATKVIRIGYLFLNNSIDIKFKTCLTNGSWDKEGSVCDQFDEWTDKSAEASPEPIRQSIRDSIRVEHLFPVYGMVAFTSLAVIIIAITALCVVWRRNYTKQYNDPNEGSAAQNNSKICKERQCEVIGWKDRPVTINTYLYTAHNINIRVKPYMMCLQNQKLSLSSINI